MSAQPPVLQTTPPSTPIPDPTTPPKDVATVAGSLQVKDTPFVIKQAGKTPYSSTNAPKAEMRNGVMADETKGYFVGPVTADKFLEFLPAVKEEFLFDESKANEFESNMKKAAKLETDMYNPFDEAIKRLVESSKLNVVNTGTQILTDFCGSDIKPDFIIHKDEWPDPKDSKEKAKKPLQNVELMIELKTNKSQDPFDDGGGEQFESTADEGKKVLGQISSYATCHLAMQARTCVFQVLVIRDYCRLLRWDHSGAVVTGKIPLSSKSFSEFFWRFCHLDASHRGWDTTMGKPSDEERNEAKAAFERAGKELYMSLCDSSEYYGKIRLGEKGGCYIVHRLFSGTQSPFGRGTRGYAAYCLKRKKVVFLKSTWRVLGDGRKPEHEIYGILHGKGVKHIPTVVEYLEVKGHLTKTQEWQKTSKKWNLAKKLRAFQHYILVLEELCRPLESFRSTKELLTVFGDATDGHQQGIDKARLLHRDISPGNILITKEGRGMLSDWEMAKLIDDIKDGGSQPERTGTFQFLSARFVNPQFDFGPHNRLDDLESFFHTLQWIVLRYVNHGMDRFMLGVTLHDTFDKTTTGANGLVICNGRVLGILQSIWNTCPNFRGVLRDLLEKLRKTISSRYVPAEDMEEAEASFQDYLGEREKGTITANTTKAAKLAILLNDFRNPTWFRDRLRDAASSPQCPTDDASKRQAYQPVEIQGSKKITKSEYNTKVSAIEYYYESQHASKKLKLDTDAAYPEESGNEMDHTQNDKDSDFEHRRRKTPYGRFDEKEGARE